MSDPLSIAAGTAGFVSLGLEVTKSLASYYRAYTGRDQNVTTTLRKLDNLLKVLELLNNELHRRATDQGGGHTGSENTIQAIRDCSNQCLEKLSELKKELEKFDPQSRSTEGFRNNVRGIGRNVAYPFRRDTLDSIERSVDSLRDDVSTALDVLQLKDDQYILDELVDIKDSVAHIRQYQINEKIRAWLNPPDAYTDHNRILIQRQRGTSFWFLNSLEFKQWRDRKTSFLWLQGFAGRGKTVICSAAIQKTISYSAQTSGLSLGVAFYYFSFQEVSKQNTQGLLRALSFQLATQEDGGEGLLKNLSDSCRGTQLSQPELCDLLRELVQRFTAVYFLWDAVDEVPAGRTRDQLLEVLNIIRSWPNVHIFITSRDLEDIRMQVDPRDQEELSMKNPGQDNDVQHYITSRLATDPRLQRWHEFHYMIRNALREKADGVWVDCQLQFIARLPKSEARLREALASLPADLEETYERMLRDIDPKMAADAKRLLSILAFSCTELKVDEILDALAIDLEDSVHFDESKRLHGPDDLHLLCPGLIETDKRGYARIAHFSVREYLISMQIRTSKASYFALDPDVANYLLARMCLVNSEPILHRRLSRRFQEHWAFYYSHTVATRKQLDKAILHILESDPRSHDNLVDSISLGVLEYQELPDTDTSVVSWTDHEIFGNLVSTVESAGVSTIHPIGCLLRIASAYQKETVFRRLLNAKYRDNSITLIASTVSIYSQGLTLLHRAVKVGSTKWVGKLLDLGADGNVPYEKRLHNSGLRSQISQQLIWYPLSEAVECGFADKVQLLLTHGAKVNAINVSFLVIAQSSCSSLGDHSETALDKAEGKKDIYEMLVNAGGLPLKDLRINQTSDGSVLRQLEKNSEESWNWIIV